GGRRERSGRRAKRRTRREPQRRSGLERRSASRDRRKGRHRPAAGDQQRHGGRRQRWLRPRPVPRGHRAATRGGGSRVRDRVRVDPVSLGSGAIIAAVGILVLLDSAGAIDVSLGWIAVVLTGAVGAILLLGGLADNGAERHD